LQDRREASTHERTKRMMKMDDDAINARYFLRNAKRVQPRRLPRTTLPLCPSRWTRNQGSKLQGSIPKQPDGSVSPPITTRRTASDLVLLPLLLRPSLLSVVRIRSRPLLLSLLFPADTVLCLDIRTDALPCLLVLFATLLGDLCVC
jgi:hypothetical protein